LLKPVGIAKLVAKKAEDKKAQEIVILELKNLTFLTDYFVIVSGNSNVQVKAIANAIVEELKEKKVWLKHIEGYQEANWILLDCHEVIIHIFHKERREYYQIEELWGDAKKISY